MTRRFRGGLEGGLHAGGYNRLVQAVIGRETDDETALEYALGRDVRLGLGFWFVLEVKRRLGETSDPELLHTDALLALYYLGTYRLPRERDEFDAE